MSFEWEQAQNEWFWLRRCTGKLPVPHPIPIPNSLSRPHVKAMEIITCRKEGFSFAKPSTSIWKESPSMVVPILGAYGLGQKRQAQHELVVLISREEIENK